MLNSKIPEVQQAVKNILNVDKTYKIVPESQHDMILKGKFSGLDPLILVNGKLVKLTTYNPLYGAEFNRIKKFKESGWPIKFISLKASKNYAKNSTAIIMK
jgi:hypothetical protein